MLNFGLSEWIPCCIEEFYSQTSIQLFVVKRFKLMKSKHFFVKLQNSDYLSACLDFSVLIRPCSLIDTLKS